ncbi:hypothetical protein [Nostoc sp. FACHB-190]|nr:hypothetical protein [Nostoc sp. FACHB-190]
MVKLRQVWIIDFSKQYSPLPTPHFLTGAIIKIVQLPATQAILQLIDN